MKASLRALVAAMAVGTMTAGHLAAQGSFTITPYAGMYVPTRNTFSDVTTDVKRNNAFIGGLRLTAWGARVVGFEFTGAYSPAKSTVLGATLNGERNTKVFLGAAKLMLGVSPASSKVGLHLGLGPAIIRRGDDVLREGESSTDLGGVVGAGVRVAIGSALGLRFDIEDYLYGGDFDGSRKFQNDLVLSVGLSLGL